MKRTTLSADSRYRFRYTPSTLLPSYGVMPEPVRRAYVDQVDGLTPRSGSACSMTVDRHPHGEAVDVEKYAPSPSSSRVPLVCGVLRTTGHKTMVGFAVCPAITRRG